MLAPSPAAIQVPSTFIPAQNLQIFGLVLLKTQVNLQRVQADLEKVKAEKNVIQAKSQIELKCLRRESEARVTVFTTSAANKAWAQRPRSQASRNDKDLQGAVPPEIADLSLQFVDLF